MALEVVKEPILIENVVGVCIIYTGRRLSSPNNTFEGSGAGQARSPVSISFTILVRFEPVWLLWETVKQEETFLEVHEKEEVGKGVLKGFKKKNFSTEKLWTCE